MIPCSTGLGSRALLFQGPQEAPPWRSGEGWGVGLGRGAGEETPHQESQRQGCALPREPPLRPPALLPAPCSWVACCFSFLPSLPPPPEPALPCAALHGPPKPGQPERNMGNHRPTQKRLWRGATSLPAGRPLTLASFTQDSLSAWSANTLPTLGRAPPHPRARK